MWFLYILLCANGSLYTGIALDPHKRFLIHQKGRGARYTKMHKPIEILYTERLSSHSDALKRERELKRWSRKRKETLMQKAILEK